MKFTWARTGGYECSSKGDKRFSALFAHMPDGRTIEQWYQCDVKGYQIGGTNWRLGKGKPPMFDYPPGHQWQMYLSLWRLWAINNEEALTDLMHAAIPYNYVLSDMFATSDINQARALVTIINEWILRNSEPNEDDQL